MNGGPGVILETATAKLVALASGVALVFAGASGVGSSLVSMAAQDVAASSMFERIAPNFALGALGMFLIYKLGVKAIDDLGTRIDEVLREIRSIRGQVE